MTDRGPRTGPTWTEVLPAGVRSVHQPLVDLATGTVVGSEALLRGPAGTAWESPLALLDAARASGRLAELDVAAIGATARSLAAEPDGGTVFVNVEPASLTTAPDDVVRALGALLSRFRVVVEITERALAVDPAGMLAGAERLREAGCAVALDDVGAEPESLAFIPLLRPEVVKLDLGLLRRAHELATVTVAGAVRAYAEAACAEVVAEGIETEADLTTARVLGATLGQGWLWGRPSSEVPRSTPTSRFGPRPVGAALHASPFEIVSAVRTTQRAPKRLLLPLTRTVEQAAMVARVPPLMLASFQHVRHLTPLTLERYERYAEHLPFVGILGLEMPRSPRGDVRGGALDVADPLATEWTVTVLGAHESLALVAREVPAQGPVPDGEREFDVTVTHDAALVTSVTHAMIGRLSA